MLERNIWRSDQADQKTIETNNAATKANEHAVHGAGDGVGDGVGDGSASLHLPELPELRQAKNEVCSEAAQPKRRSESGPPHKYETGVKLSEKMHLSEQSRSNCAVSFWLQVEASPLAINLERQCGIRTCEEMHNE